MSSKDNVYINQNERIFYLSDSINNETIGSTIFSLLSLIESDNFFDKKEKNYERKPIKIYINSFGGSVYDMWGLIDIIINSKTPIYTYCTGYAMSAAFNIFIAGHKRFVYPHSTLMYHQITLGEYGTYQQLVEHKEENDWLQTKIEDFVMSKTKLTKDKLEEIRKSKHNVYIHSDKAIELGLADEILGGCNK